MILRLRNALVACLLVTLLFVTSCAKAPSQFSQAQKDSTARGATAVVKESTTGGTFNKYFPNDSKGYNRVYTQEKKGFAEAKLKKDGKDVAVISISDTVNNPSAVDKFKLSKDSIGGYPAVSQGTTATAVLVNERYQVKILSRDPSFTEADRKAWLAKFDLNGLAKLK